MSAPLAKPEATVGGVYFGVVLGGVGVGVVLFEHEKTASTQIIKQI
jgi:Leu/Phe-tRNA-protein transferase